MSYVKCFGKWGRVMKKSFKVFLSFCCILFLIIAINYFTTKFEEHASKMVVSNVNELINIKNTEDRLSVDKIEYLQNYYGNNDVKGIISIDGVDNFSYPVVQTMDNDYYLNHNYYKEYDAYGAIYADYRVDLDSSKKVLIFGHSSSKTNTPFNGLEDYYDEDYYKAHKYITLETKTNVIRYEIFSVYVETSDFTYMNMNFGSAREWYLHILGLQKKSLYQTNVELNDSDNILILQTCSTNSKYSSYSKKYLLIVSRRVN